MKKLICLSILLLSVIATCQNVAFDGTIFKDKLLLSDTNNDTAKDSDGNNIKIDANNDGIISQAEALLVFELNIPNAGIPNLTGLEFFTNIEKLNCKQNNFETINVSTLLNLLDLDVSENTSLLTIYAKNGKDENSIIFGASTPNLVYICADDFQQVDLLDSDVALPNYEVNSYCSIGLGGNFNTITGTVLFDENNNGIDPSDIRQPNVKVFCFFDDDDDADVNYQTVTNELGEYQFFNTNNGTFQLRPLIDHPNWFTNTGVVTSGFPDTEGNNLNVDFVLAPIGVHFDLEVIIQPVVLPLVTDPENPVYEIVFKNKGNQTQSGQVTFTYNSSLLEFVSSVLPANTAVNSQTPGSITINYSNLKPFQSKAIQIELNTLTPLVSGQELNFLASINTNGEAIENQGDNEFQYIQTVLNSIETSWLKCLQLSNLPTSEIGNFLHYSLRVQNDASQDANFVESQIIFDPSQFDINSIQILNSTISNPSLPLEYNKVGVQIVNNTANFRVKSSLQSGEPGGSGGILLRIRTVNSLSNGATVQNSSSIFFDYNYDSVTAPIVVDTNIATTTFNNLSNTIVTFDQSVQIYPNPAESIVNIKATSPIVKIELYDMFGKQIQTYLDNNMQIAIDISKVVSGIYFLKITTSNGQKVEKIIKK